MSEPLEHLTAEQINAATAVRGAVTDLNAVLRIAAEAGLYVELNTSEMETFAIAMPQIHVIARILTDRPLDQRTHPLLRVRE